MRRLDFARRFASDRNGNIAIIAGLMMPVFVTCMATAVDLTHVYSYKRNLQQSLDASALAAAKEYGVTQDDAVLEQWAEAYFFTNADRLASFDVDFDYEGIKKLDGNTVLRVSARRDIPTYFGSALKAVTGGALDYETFTLDLFSEIVVQNRSIEMVLVLDNSGSMDATPSKGGKRKIATLKDAAESLVEQILKPQSAANTEHPMKMGIVPFSSAVNVGTEYADAAWMDTNGYSPIHHENLDWANWTSGPGNSEKKKLARSSGHGWVHRDTGEFLTRFYLFDEGEGQPFRDGWGGCVEARPEGLAITDAPAREASPASLFVPYFAPDEYEDDHVDASNDYVTDKEINNITDSKIIAAQSGIAKYLDDDADFNSGGPNYGCEAVPLTPLTSSREVMLDAVDDLVARGNTNIPEGLAWGWRLLSQQAPFSEGRASDARDNMKILVLMTDGENTYSGTGGVNRSTFGAYGYGQVWHDGDEEPGRMFDATTKTIKRASTSNYVAAMNEMTASVCQNIKDDGRNPDGSDGIVIFTIAFDLKDGTPVKKLMENCASDGLSDPTKKLYYDAESSTELVAAFDSIVDEISSLRIAR